MLLGEFQDCFFCEFVVSGLDISARSWRFWVGVWWPVLVWEFVFDFLSEFALQFMVAFAVGLCDVILF